jgi:hypothetical protein
MFLERKRIKGDPIEKTRSAEQYFWQIQGLRLPEPSAIMPSSFYVSAEV